MRRKPNETLDEYVARFLQATQPPIVGMTATEARELERKMTTTTEQRRTIEARLDRLKARLGKIDCYSSDALRLKDVLKGTLDLLTDVLLEDDHG